MTRSSSSRISRGIGRWANRPRKRLSWPHRDRQRRHRDHARRCRRVRTDRVHGRHRRPIPARIRPGHRHRDAVLTAGLLHADAAAFGALGAGAQAQADGPFRASDHYYAGDRRGDLAARHSRAYRRRDRRSAARRAAHAHRWHRVPRARVQSIQRLVRQPAPLVPRQAVARPHCAIRIWWGSAASGS